MARIEKFENINAWNSARKLTKDVYSLTRKENFSKDYGLASQIQRASVSTMSNIAEGFERKSNKEFIQFLYIAKGSVGELRSQLYTALDLKYISEKEFNECYELATVISKKLSAFIKYLNSIKIYPRTFKFRFLVSI